MDKLEPLKPLTAERLRHVLQYEPLTGVFTRRATGEIAGSVDTDGYRRIRVDGRKYQAGRLAFLYVTGAWPKAKADHKDGERDNNRWGNLRDASSSQNGMNRPADAQNKSGFKGVHLTTDGRFRAELTVNGKRKHVSYARSAEAAARQYDAAAILHHGEFARVNFPKEVANG